MENMDVGAVAERCALLLAALRNDVIGMFLVAVVVFARHTKSDLPT